MFLEPSSPLQPNSETPWKLPWTNRQKHKTVKDFRWGVAAEAKRKIKEVSDEDIRWKKEMKDQWWEVEMQRLRSIGSIVSWWIEGRSQRERSNRWNQHFWRQQSKSTQIDLCSIASSIKTSSSQIIPFEFPTKSILIDSFDKEFVSLYYGDEIEQTKACDQTFPFIFPVESPIDFFFHCTLKVRACHLNWRTKRNDQSYQLFFLSWR